jgi:hypothetical protein
MTDDTPTYLPNNNPDLLLMLAMRDKDGVSVYFQYLPIVGFEIEYSLDGPVAHIPITVEDLSDDAPAAIVDLRTSHWVIPVIAWGGQYG